MNQRIAVKRKEMKIKAKDLRIGNLHKINEISIPRLQIHSAVVSGTAYASISAYGIHLVDANEMVFEPIRLTDEWLVRLGFEKCKPNAFSESLWKNKSFVLFQDGNDFFKCEWIYNSIIQESDYELFNVPINYAHQLQNLYYILTGEELTITP